MAKTLHRRDLIPLVVVAVMAVGLVAVAAYTYLHRPFLLPLDTVFTSLIYLPLVSKDHRTTPDARFGVAEHTPEEAAVLGLAKAHYISGQWRLPLPGDTVVFFTITERDHWSTWKLCSWSPRNGWYDEQGCREWIQKHPGAICVVGNELGVGSPIGIGDLVNTTQYARWYHEAWILIKSEDPNAVVAPYGPVGQVTAGLLIDVWDSYRAQFGSLLEADFYPVHHYCQPGDGPEWCWTKLLHWVDWLEQHRGTNWEGPKDYWLAEWGLPAWSYPIPLEASLELMTGMAPRLQNNTLGISQHAWWPSCNSGWPDQCTLLVRNGQPTELGEKYLELAFAP